MNTEKKPDTEEPIKKMNSPNAGNWNASSNGKTPPPSEKSPKRGNPLNLITIMFLITFLINIFLNTIDRDQQIEYSQFLKLIDTGNISQVQLDTDTAEMTLNPNANLKEVEQILYPNGRVQDSPNQPEPTLEDTYITVLVEDPTLVERLSDNDVHFYKVKTTQNSPILSFVASWILPFLMMYIMYSFFFKKLFRNMNPGGGSNSPGGMMNVGKSKAKEYNLEKNTGIKFTDVAGQDEAKESLAELSDFLNNPKKYQEIGAKQPRGALLVGPPGTGKTLLAKALAGESGVPFYSISGSEFVEMFVGVGASRVRDLFANAKKNAPCIIFIDEIDAIGKSRDNQFSSNDEREQTLNQLLAEMDGFDGEKGIVVLAATNRPEILDKALLRPGRFDRRIIVEKPDLLGREAILKVHAQKVKLSDDVDLRDIALATSGATGADLANMINEGALLAVKEGRKLVEQKDLMEAVEVVIAGKEKKDRIMNQKERRMVAYHEVGHALTSALQKNSQPVHKITIVPRTMGSLGYTMNMPEEERYLLTKSELLAQIVTLLGGRAAEIVQFGEITTGASNDIERATALARGMVTQYGMSDKFGPVGLESTQNKYLDGNSVKHCSPETETQVDDEVRQIILECQNEAIKLLEDNKEALDRISNYLLEKENITGKEFMNLLHETA